MGKNAVAPSALTHGLLLCLVATLATYAYAIERSDIFTTIDASEGFTEDLFPAFATMDTMTEAVSMAEGKDGSLYIVGHVEAVDGDTSQQSFAIDEQGDQFGEQDIFLLKLAKDGTKSWHKRLGSRGFDIARDVVVDSDNNVYLCGSIGRPMGDVESGAVIFKYDGDGVRKWTKAFGSKAAQDTLNGIILSTDETELISTGTIGSQSALHTAETKRDGFNVVVLRISAGNGDSLKMAVGNRFDSSLGAFGNDLVLKVVEGHVLCFVVGYSKSKPKDAYLNNGLIHVFKYPELEELTVQQIESQTADIFSSVASSLNEFSVFAVGTREVSIYEQKDAFIARFNTSDLGLGWSKTVGSIKFDSQANVVPGAATEIGKQVTGDEFGNVYMLLEASGPVGPEDIHKSLKNKRTALIVFAPNGTVVHKMQSQRTQATSPTCMIASLGRVLIAGWTVDKSSNLYRIYLSGVALPKHVFKNFGPEHAPSKTTTPTPTPPDKNGDGDRTTEKSKSNTKIVAGAAGGAVGLLIVAIAGVAIGMRNRNNQ